jgi:hypothetical protein
MKINQIGLSRLRNDTHFQFHTEFKDLAQKHNPIISKYAIAQAAHAGKIHGKKGKGKGSEGENAG